MFEDVTIGQVLCVLCALWVMVSWIGLIWWANDGKVNWPGGFGGLGEKVPGRFCPKQKESLPSPAICTPLSLAEPR